MTAMEYLLQVRAINEKIRQIERELEALRTTETSLRSPWPDGQPRGSGLGDPVGREAARVADKIRTLERQLIRKRGELHITRAAVIETIGKVDSPTLNRLLYEKYVTGKDREQIAADLGYTVRHINNLHQKALEEVEVILEGGTT